MRSLFLNFYAVMAIAFFASEAHAKTVRYELTIRNEKVNLSGKKEVDFALTVNGGIPAPTLEFTEGDDAEITVVNQLPSDDDVSIHWHGILLPPEQDGVPFVNTPPIYRGQSHTFRFKLRQSGTYWYHSHTMLQEQKGVFGAIVIHPKKETIKADKEVVAILSDWSDEDADKIIRNLRKDGDYYLYKKGTMRSYAGAIKAGKLGTQLKNEWTRMGGMDLSDVGYDAFLMNGKRDSQLSTAHPGEKVRLRIINGSASTYFRVSLGSLPMRVISADGLDIQPIMANEIMMGIAETYDVLFTVPEHKNFELRATAQDGTGYSSGWIGMGEKVPAKTVPQPDMYASMDHSGHGGMDHSMMGHDSMPGMNHGSMPEMDHSKSHEAMPGMSHEGKAGINHSAHAEHGQGHTNHNSQQPSSALHGHQHESADTPPAKAADTMGDPAIETLTVDNLRALKSTVIPHKGPIHDIKLVLDGDMRRYVWFINGKTISEDRLLTVNPGEIVRITYQNDSMMHHPMHLHGHFFRVLNKNGDYSPLKHTVDVPPMSSRTIEFYTDEVGQWMLHCHVLYHMDTGMARVVKYSNYSLPASLAAHEKHDHHMQDPWYTYGKLEISSNHAEGNFRVSQSWNEFQARVEGANIRGKNFSYNDKWDYEADLFYRRWMDKWFNLIVGGTSFGEKIHGVVGVGYTLPFLVETNLLLNHDGQIRLDVERKFQWTKNIFSDVDLTWRPGDQGGEHKVEVEASLMYSPKWAWAAGLMLTNDSLGGGIEFQF